MLRSIIIIVVLITGRLALAPWASAQETPAAGPIAAAAAREAVRLDPQPARGPMPTGLKWTGIGLVLHGAAVGTSGLIFCAANACGRKPEVGFGVAGISALAGAIVLHIADRKRPSGAPEAAAVVQGPIEAAAIREAAHAARPTDRSMPPGLKWTGVSLLGSSLVILADAKLRDCRAAHCGGRRQSAYVVSGATAAAGALLLAVGEEIRRGPAASLPSVSVGGGRVSITQRLSF